jgi:hypothetical protein
MADLADLKARANELRAKARDLAASMADLFEPMSQTLREIDALCAELEQQLDSRPPPACSEPR